MPSSTLYYDGHCPLCLTEMEKLKRYRDDHLELIDIHSLPETSQLPEKKVLLASLHLQQQDGSFMTGLEANVAAWQHTRFGVFFRWLRWPVFNVVANRIYMFWARRRYRRLYGE